MTGSSVSYVSWWSQPGWSQGFRVLCVCVWHTLRCGDSASPYKKWWHRSPERQRHSATPTGIRAVTHNPVCSWSSGFSDPSCVELYFQGRALPVGLWREPSSLTRGTEGAVERAQHGDIFHLPSPSPREVKGSRDPAVFSSSPRKPGESFPGPYAGETTSLNLDLGF